jgi:hypothetical protein
MAQLLESSDDRVIWVLRFVHSRSSCAASWASRACREPKSDIRQSVSTVGALEHQCKIGTLTFCALPIERSDQVASHDCPYHALSLGGFGTNAGRPDVHLRAKGLPLLDGGAELRRDRAQGLADKFVRPFLNQALVGATNQYQRPRQELRDLPHISPLCHPARSDCPSECVTARRSRLSPVAAAS